MKLAASARLRTLLSACQLLVTVALLAYALNKADLSKALAQLLNMSVSSVLTCLALSVFQITLLVYRWNAILACMDRKVPVLQLLRGTLTERFFTQLLPTAAGGDVARGIYLISANTPASVAVLSIIFDRVAGIMGMVLLAGVCAVAALATAPSHSMFYLPICLALFSVAATALCAFLPRAALERLLAPAHFLGLDSLVLGWQSLSRKPAFYTSGIGVSCLIQLFFSAIFVVLAAGQFDRHALVGIALLSPVMLLATILPLTVAGWGLRESAAAAVFQVVGIAPLQAIDLSVEFGLVQLFVGMLSAVAFIALYALRGPSRTVLAESKGGVIEQ